MGKNMRELLIYLTMCLIGSILMFLFERLSRGSAGWSFTRCPEECTCQLDVRMRHLMDCSSRELEMFPKPETIPADVEVINAHNNLITEIPDDYKFWLPSLARLDLSANRLRTFPLFNGVVRPKYINLDSNNITGELNATGLVGLGDLLRELRLGNNQLTSIATDTFIGAHQLEYLDLRNNHLKIMPRLGNLWHLKDLILSGNRIDILGNNLLSAPGLRMLRLDGNQIVAVQMDIQVKCNHLMHLNLSGNQLPVVPQQLMHKLAGSLRVIDFSHNPITAINTDDFVAMISLKRINIADANLSVVASGAFRNLPELQNLNLANNKALGRIADDAFGDLQKLNSVHLHACNLTTLIGGLEGLLESPLVTITLDKNPLTCHCSLQWLERILHNDVLLGNSSIKCQLDDGGTEPEAVSLHAMPGDCTPRIFNFPPKTITFEGHHQTVIECHAFGLPKPTITWFGPNNLTTLGAGAKLTLINVSMAQNASHLACVADSVSGETRAATQLIVLRHPHLEAKQVSLVQIVVRWRPSDGQAILTMASGGDAFRSEMALEQNISEVLLDGMHLLVDYEFCLLHVNGVPIQCTHVTRLPYLKHAAIQIIVCIVFLLFIIGLIRQSALLFDRYQELPSARVYDSSIQMPKIAFT